MEEEQAYSKKIGEDSNIWTEKSKISAQGTDKNLNNGTEKCHVMGLISLGIVKQPHKKKGGHKVVYTNYRKTKFRKPDPTTYINFFSPCGKSIPPVASSLNGGYTF